MLDLRKFFHAEVKDDPSTEIESQGGLRRGLEEEYGELIAEQLARGGVALSCVGIEVRSVGTAPDQKPVFLGMLRLARWERRAALRLLLGLPILEAKLRRVTNGSWLKDVSHFGGLWLHASGQLQDTSAMHELRALIVDLERGESAPDSGTGGVWSLPTDLGKLG